MNYKTYLKNQSIMRGIIENAKNREKDVNIQRNRIVKKHNEIIKSSKKLENAYKFIYQIPENELVCYALTPTFQRCKRKAKYLHGNMNETGKNSKRKKDVPLCQVHCKQALKSDDKKTLKHGFYFESDKSDLFESEEYLGDE